METGLNAAATQRSTKSELIVRALWCVVLCATLLWAYQPSFVAPFYLDSHYHLKELPRYAVTELSAEQLGNSIRRAPGGPLYRPVSSLTFGLNHYFIGPEPAGFRVVNVIIHALAALALAFMFSAVTRTPPVRRRHPFVAGNERWLILGAATLWALHPIQTGAVTYVIQRMAMLAGLFIFLSVGCYIRGRLAGGAARLGWWAACVAALVLGVFSKGNGALAIPLCFAAEIVFFKNWQSRSYRKWLGGALCAFVALVLAMAVWLGPQLVEQFRGLLAVRDFTLLERVLTEARLQLRYLYLLLAPDQGALQFDADIVLSTGVFSPPHTALALALVISLLFCAYRCRGRAPLVSFGIAWFFLAQTIEATVIPLELYFEHRMYLPSVWVFFGVAALFAASRSRLNARRSPLARLPVAAGVALAALMVFQAHARNVTWGDPLLFAQDSFAKSPDKPRNLVRYAKVLSKLGNNATDDEERRRYYREARARLELVEELAPDDFVARRDLAIVYRRLGQLDKFEGRLRALQKEDPEKLKLAVRGTLASFLLEKGEYGAALPYAAWVAERAPHKAYNQAVLSVVLSNLGRNEEALKRINRALELEPDNPKYLGVATQLRGESGGKAP